MIASSSDRVKVNTDDALNERIARDAGVRITFYAQNPELIDERLQQLDEEWDIERALETGSSCLTLAGLVLGVGSSRKWLLLSMAVQGFFLQHALQGWCPPLPVLRALGFRTADEINQERYALKALRGDFDEAHDNASAAMMGVGGD